MTRLRHCAISVDVDSINSMRIFYGLAPEPLPAGDPVYQKAIPRFLDLFDKHGVRATFFIIGEDCAYPATKEMLKKIISRGHEVANHSLRHTLGFSMLTAEEKQADINESTEKIAQACGHAPVGFRVPGYDIDEDTINILERSGYHYDSSMYSFIIYMIARRIRFLKLGRIRKKDVFKNMKKEFFNIFSPKEAYYPYPGSIWRRGKSRGLLEMPLSVVPFLNLPFNSTFLYLLHPKVFDLGLGLSAANDMDLNYNFHASDMLSEKEDAVQLKHPGLDMGLDSKETMFGGILKKIQKASYKFVTLEILAEKNSRGQG